MKLTKARLKEIVEEELGEVIRPKMQITPGIPPVRSGELRSPITPAPSRGAELSDLFNKVVTTHKVAKADPSVPEHVVSSLSQIAGQIASLMSVSEEKEPSEDDPNKVIASIPASREGEPPYEMSQWHQDELDARDRAYKAFDKRNKK